MNSTQTDVLLVDDSREDVEPTSHILRREKLASRIHIARDGEEAFDYLFCRGAFVDRSCEPEEGSKQTVWDMARRNTFVIAPDMTQLRL